MLDVTLIVNSDNGVESYVSYGESIDDVLQDLKEQVEANKKLFTS